MEGSILMCAEASTCKNSYKGGEMGWKEMYTLMKIYLKQLTSFVLLFRVF